MMAIHIFLAALFVLVNGQSFSSSPQDVTVLEGEVARLRCGVERPDPNLVVMWLNGSQVLTFDRRVLSQSTRFNIVGDSFDLEIHDVTTYDDGVYLCQISTTPPLNQESRLNVHIPASVKLVPEDEREKKVALGSILALHCQAEGTPDPNVTWTRINGKMPTGEKVYRGGLYIDEEIGKDDSGLYQCTADNGYGDGAIQQVKVDVVYPPTVAVEEEIIHTGPGVKTEIKCIFSASPDPDVVWYLNNREIRVAERNNFQHNKGHDGSDDIFTLVIDGVREDDLGNYTCNGRNDRGMAEASLHLTALPSQTKIKSKASGLYGSMFTIQWEVTSFPHISDYELKIRQVNESTKGNWSMVIVPGDMKHVDEVHRKEFKALDLLPESEYDVKVRAKNKFGWGKWSKLFTFSTADADSTPPPDRATTEGDYYGNGDRSTEDDVITDVEVSQPPADGPNGGAASISISFFSIMVASLVALLIWN